MKNIFTLLIVPLLAPLAAFYAADKPPATRRAAPLLDADYAC
jgi:hypothetical protein